MNFGELKPVLAALLLPPALPLLGVLIGVSVAGLAAHAARPFRRRLGWMLVLLSAAVLWLLSCNAVAVWLGQQMLPQFAALAPQRAAVLRAEGVQAVVVLGGGVLPSAPEYGVAQPAAPTAARLRYGFNLSRAAGLPLAFSGGVGWSAAGTGVATEASTAARLAAEQGLRLVWAEDQSRDTAENAARLHALMRPAGITRIALVTHAWHMPRSVRRFEAAGFAVLPAPTGFIVPLEQSLLEWLPSAQGLTSSRQVLREWLALRLA